MLRIPLALLALSFAAACDSTEESNRPAPIPPCTTTADCTSGTCLNSRCVADGSVAGGQACDLDQQCRSGTCLTDTCEYAPGEPGGPCATGDTCDAGASCLEDLCVADGSLGPGDTCDDNDQCGSGECIISVTSICAAGVGDDCASVPCESSSSSCMTLTNVCIGDGSLDELENCTEDRQCASGDCIDGGFACAPTTCEPTGPTGGTSFSASTDATLAGDAVLTIIWMVSSGSPDYEWVFGDATASGGTMSVNLATLPPPEAVNSYGLAIGIVIAFPTGTVVEDGLFVEPNTEWLGLTYQHAIIWKADCAEDLGWSDQFSPGYSCGACVPASGGQTFDSYTPTDCSNVMLELEDSGVEFCNWT